MGFIKDKNLNHILKESMRLEIDVLTMEEYLIELIEVLQLLGNIKHLEVKISHYTELLMFI